MAGRLKLFIPFAVFALLAIVLYFALRLDPNDLPSALIDRPVPEFSLPSLENSQEVITHDQLKGKPYLLNIWATWCTSCKYEHPYLIKLANMGIPIYGINWQDDKEAALRVLEKTGNPYQKNMFDKEGTLAMALGVTGAPETFIVDAEGIIRYKRTGIINEEVWTSEMAPIFNSN